MSTKIVSDTTTSTIQVNGVDAVVIGSTGIESGYADGSINQAALAEKPTTMTPVTVSTPVANIDFSAIPSWVKKIVVILTGATTTTHGKIDARIGDAGGLEVTGYVGKLNESGASVASVTDSIPIIGVQRSGVIVTEASFIMELFNTDGNTWAYKVTSSAGSGNIAGYSEGYKTLSAALTQLSVYVQSGGMFTVGTMTLRYEP